MIRFGDRYPHVVDECEVFIGCPSGWSETSRKIYEHHSNDEDLPKCYVVPESRAALIQAFDAFGYASNRAAEERLRDLVGRCVLVIDIGSSTIDVTLLKDLDPIEIEKGSDLGLRLVDRQILAVLCRTHPNGASIRAKIEEDRGNERFLLYLCRLAKEQAFGRSIDTGNLFKGREWAWDCWEQLLSLDLKGCLSESTFWGEEVSWFERYHTLLIEVKNALTAAEPDAVVITGGGRVFLASLRQ
jgi:hypothetical protein